MVHGVIEGRGSSRAIDGRPPSVPEGFHLTTTVVSDGDAADVRTVHTHPEHLLAWSQDRGSVTVVAEGTPRTLGPGRALWIPCGTPHAAECRPRGGMCFTYLAPEACDFAWPTVRVITLSRAARELLLYLDRSEMPDERRRSAQEIVIDMVSDRPSVAVEVPLPADERIRSLADWLLGHPGDTRSVDVLARDHGLSVRTLNRAFNVDLGMNFSRWRTLVRMDAAIALMSDGAPVGYVARRVGYSTTSAFSSAFRRCVGASPTAFQGSEDVSSAAS